MRIGIDIGGTKIDALALSDDNTIVHRTRRATRRGNAHVVDGITEVVSELLAAAPVDVSRVERIGIGIPGVIDLDRGRVRHAVNLGVEDLELTAVLAARFGVPVVIENDVNAAALGAARLLDLSEPTAYLNVGTGLAAGTVVNGRIWRGARGGAGEIGHIPADSAGALCGCGQRGCLETVASGSALTRLWPTSAAYPALELWDRADEGDADAAAVRSVFVEGVASATRVLFLTTDVETVVIGGGLSNLGDRLLDPVRACVEQWSSRSPFLAALELSGRIAMLPPGAPAAALGAALFDAPPVAAAL